MSRAVQGKERNNMHRGGYKAVEAPCSKLQGIFYPQGSTILF